MVNGVKRCVVSFSQKGGSPQSVEQTPEGQDQPCIVHLSVLLENLAAVSSM